MGGYFQPQDTPPKWQLRASWGEHSCHRSVQALAHMLCALYGLLQPVLLDFASSSCCCTLQILRRHGRTVLFKSSIHAGTALFKAKFGIPSKTKTTKIWGWDHLMVFFCLFVCFGTAYCIWSVISSFSNLHSCSSSLGLLCHVPLKRDQGDWDSRLRLHVTPDAIGCTNKPLSGKPREKCTHVHTHSVFCIYMNRVAHAYVVAWICVYQSQRIVGEELCVHQSRCVSSKSMS